MESAEKAKQRVDTFRKDVLKGLTDFPKHLSSKYFYDHNGDQLFQDIMAMPEYYLTDCEMEVITEYTQAIGELFRDREKGLDLIELGAGDGKKTKVLLKYMAEKDFNFTYKPIDISQSALKSLTLSLADKMPSLDVDGEVGEYFEVLERLKTFDKRKKVIMILGSNLGNLRHPQAIVFLKKLKNALLDEDLLFMGLDQKKDPKIILDAYNDAAGITEAFNKNILVRINRELGANFKIDKFRHWEAYNPETGTAKSFLVATEAMEVYIKELDQTINFDAWETIHTEISQKYDDKVVAWLAEQADLEIVKSFTDKKGYYKNYAFRRK